MQRQILANFDQEGIIVYQAFNPSIAEELCRVLGRMKRGAVARGRGEGHSIDVIDAAFQRLFVPQKILFNGRLRDRTKFTQRSLIIYISVIV